MRKRLILIDDSADEIEFVRRALAATYPDAELTAFRSGTQALEHLTGRLGAPGAEVVLLDLKLPGLGGHAILRSLRERFGTCELPIVVFSSSREASDLARAYEAGANSYVLKPLVHEEYVTVVGQVARYWLEINEACGEEAAASA